MDIDDDPDAAWFICIMISATISLNLYDELSECCTKPKLEEFAYLCPTGMAFRSRSIYDFAGSDAIVKYAT